VLERGQPAPAAAGSSAHRIGGGGPDDHLAQAIVRGASQIGAVRAASPVVRTDLRTGQMEEHAFEVEGAGCYAIVVAGVPSVRELRVEVKNALGLVEEQGRGASPVAVRFCPQVAGRYRVTVRVFNGYGRVALQLVALAPGR
jgi:hypothetical protein